MTSFEDDVESQVICRRDDWKKDENGELLLLLLLYYSWWWFSRLWKVGTVITISTSMTCHYCLPKTRSYMYILFFSFLGCNVLPKKCNGSRRTTKTEQIHIIFIVVWITTGKKHCFLERWLYQYVWIAKCIFFFFCFHIESLLLSPVSFAFYSVPGVNSMFLVVKEKMVEIWQDVLKRCTHNTTRVFFCFVFS